MINKILATVLFALLLAGSAQATVFWQADTNRGTAVFAGLNIDPSYGTITVAPDPLAQYGNVYRFFLQDTNSAYGKERTESSGTSTPSGEFLPAYNTDYYIGWRAMWNPMPINGSWVALFQMHGYGVTGQGAPLVLRCVNGDGNVYMQNNANGVDTNFWHTTFRTNVWQTFVVHVFLSTNYSQGYTEIWYNGVLQTNNAGTTRWYGPTWDNVDGVWSDSYNKLKWGVYRSGSLGGKGDATAYMSNAKVGSTYADVDPNGGGDFSMTTTPASQSVAPGASANYTVTVSPLNGFATNVNFSASGLPAGATAGFSPPSITNSGASTMTISTTGSTPIGSYTINVLGTNQSLAHSNTVTFVVSSFTLLAAPPSQNVNVGSNAMFTVTVTTNSSFTGSINLGIGGAPADVSAGFAPATLNQSGSSTLTVSTTTNTAGGSYLLTIFGTNGSFVATTAVNLTIAGLQANPGVLVWTNGAADANWSSTLNWTNVTAGGYGPPGISNSVLFTNFNAMTASALTSPGSGVVVPANVNSFVNGNYTIASWTNFNNSATANYQNIGIASNCTLTVVGNFQIGDNTSFDFGGNNVVNATISGAGGTLQVNSNLWLIETSGSSGSHNAMLDLSGLDNFAMGGGQIRVGVEGSSPHHYATGCFYLAKTNNLTLTLDGTGALYIGHNKSSAPSIPPALYLGIQNSIYFFNNTGVIVGRANTPGSLLTFNPAFVAQNPTAYFRGADDNSRVATWSVGDNSANANNSANVTSGTNDFTSGTLDALVGTMELGVSCPSGASASGNGTGTFTFNSGTLDVNILQLGVDTGNSGTSAGIGVLNINGGLLTVNSNLQLGVFVTGSGGTPQGTLNVNGGTVQATNIIGGGTSVINLNSGTMDLQPDWAATFGTISNISTLNVGANGVGGFALLTDVAQVSTTGTLNIATNGTISGNTIFNTPNLVVGGTLSPGNEGAGAMTNTGAITFGAGGSYAVTIDDAAAGPVLGWSFLQSGGGINIQSSAANPFVIDVGTADNPAANFNSNSNYDWMIATAGGGIVNFATNKFVINSSQFQNSLGIGSFYLHTNGSSLVLSFTNNLPAVVLPVAVNIAAGANGFVFSGSNGSSGRQFYLLASTNLALPFNQWTSVATNNFDSNGNFIFTNPANDAALQTFYLLQLQ
jgi:hypothetical protein